jgi:transcriptional regulator with XRE-family HTH domain
MAMSNVLPASSVVRNCFGDRLRAARAAKFPRAMDLARALGMDEIRYLRYERGDLEPSATLIVHACIVLGVEPNDLFPPLTEL